MEEAANVLFRIGPLEVTSTVTTMWAIIAVLALVSWLATRNLKEVPGPLQTGAEMAVGALRNFFEGTLGKEHTQKYLPIMGTFFIFIIVTLFIFYIFFFAIFKFYKIYRIFLI